MASVDILRMASTLIAALRAAASPAAQEEHLSKVLDLLVSTTSVPETHRLLDAVFETGGRHSLPAHALVHRVASTVAVCSSPPRKAELLGHIVLEHLLKWVLSTASHPEALKASREALLRIAQANPAIVDGVLSAIDQQQVTSTALSIARPLIVAVLINASHQQTQKLAVIHSLVRVGWRDDSPDHDTQASVTSLFASVVPLIPLTADADAWRVYNALIASTVELFEASTQPRSAVAVAYAVLRRVFFGLEQQLSVLPLLQSLLQLSRAYPDTLCTSRILWDLGTALQHDAASAKDQSLILDILQVQVKNDSSTRAVYVESLVVPLASVLSTHSSTASTLLQGVLDTAATTPFSVDVSLDPEAPLGHHAAHAATFLTVVASSTATTEEWLTSLFQRPTPDIQNHSSTLLRQLGACLVDRRGHIRSLALDALTRQLVLKRANRTVDDWPPASIKLLVSTLVVLSSHQRNASSKWLSQCFQVLASVAATTTETMKVILRLVKKMASTSGLKAQALHLLRLVWTQDSRVYPQLEAMLQSSEEDEEDDEMERVRMATILAMREHDPETGVDWIGEVQGFLESESVGVVAMAVHAIRLLCVADCLELETTIKFLSIKMKKKRVVCVDDPLFLTELCAFYGCCGAGGVEGSSPKYAARVVVELWSLSDSEEATVRAAAFSAMASFSLEGLGLRLVGELEKSRQGRGADGGEEEEEDEDVLTAEELEENVDRVWDRLQREEDVRVRVEIETVTKRILGTECAKLPSARGGDVRVSAAATRELKKLLPSRQQVVDGGAAGSSLLLAFECEDVVESSAAPKRKDKRMRVVSAQVEEMKGILRRTLSGGGETLQLLDSLRAVDAWRSFGGKLVDRVSELATLRTPNDAAPGHTAGLLQELVGELVGELVAESHPQRWLAIAGVVHHLSACALASAPAVVKVLDETRAELRAQWRQAMEAERVFQGDAKRSDAVRWLLLALALATPSDRDEEADADVARVLAWLRTGGGGATAELAQAAALLHVGHISSLSRGSEDRHKYRQQVKAALDVAVQWLVHGSSGSTVSVCVDAFSAASVASGRSVAGSTVQWAAAMAIAQLAPSLAAVGRLVWLDNLRQLLQKVWTATTPAVAVALGPVLLESLRFNRVDARNVQRFVDEALGSSSPLTTVSVAYTLRRMPGLGCVLAAADLERLLSSITEQKAESLASVAAGNLLHSSTGVLLLPSAPLKELEFVWDASVVVRAVAALDAVDQAAIADRRDAVVVVQKSTTLDAQVPTLSPSTLLFKVLDAVRVDGPQVSAAASASVLKCVAHASRSHTLPLELSALVLRVLSRFSMDDRLLMAAIELAGAHASCVALLADELLASTRLINYSASTLAVCVDAVATAQKRLSTAQLKTLLGRLFDALAKLHTSGGEGDGTTAAFNKWVELVGSLVTAPPPKEGSLAAETEEESSVSKAVATLVLEHAWPRLPHTPADSEVENRAFLVGLASHVLAKISNHDAVVDAVMARSGDHYGWWRTSVVLAELLRCGFFSSASVVLRWLQQLDMVGEKNLTVVDGVVADVVDAVVVAATAKHKTPLEANESWVVELLDAAADADVGPTRRTMLRSVVDAVVAWGELQNHEMLIVATRVAPYAWIAGSMPSLVVEALGRRRGERLTGSEAIVRLLWTADESIVRRELHVTASDSLLSQDMESEVVAQLSLQA